MLHSMTGFARESLETELGTLTWELKAVNHRYLDVQFRLPEELKGDEQTFRKLAGDTLSRGKVECPLNFRRAFDQQAELQINAELVELIGKRIKEMSAALPATGAVNPFDVLRWPGVVEAGTIYNGIMSQEDWLPTLVAAAGVPGIVERTLIRPPSSQLGPIDDAKRGELIARSPLASAYSQTVDRESAYELLAKREQELEQKRQREAEELERLEREEAARRQDEKTQHSPSGGRGRQSVGEALAKSVARTIGTTLGRQIVRGILGSITGRR